MNSSPKAVYGDAEITPVHVTGSWLGSVTIGIKIFLLATSNAPTLTFAFRFSNTGAWNKQTQNIGTKF